MGIATIIGQTSGGGMAGVMPGALMDGTTLESHQTSRSVSPSD